ncbi:MAG TPA: NAD(P)-dependent oxidoreductase [Stellaceae bacterium]|nr:NAD(P)-dependent oxidoreductase [Stellaceae bacterium]
MNIAVIGASGKAGSRVTAELLRRGHRVTAIGRHPEAVQPHERVVAREGDARDPAALAPLIAGHDAVVSATRFVQIDPAVLIAAVKAAGAKRFLVVGGAGSLLNAAGRQLVDGDDLPPQVRPEARAGSGFLALLRAEKTLDWTFLSPSGQFAPGARIGKFRLGGDHLLVAADGTSSISMEDFAIAMADEIEAPRHSRRRFTVGY